MRLGILAIAAMLLPVTANAQSLVPESHVSSALAAKLKSLDAEIFHAAFDRCDTKALRALATDDFEFYHDRGGLIAKSGDEFAADNRRECKLRAEGKKERLRRELIPGSVTFHALGKDGVMQMGRHRFYILHKGKPDQLIEVAKFIHVWRKTPSGWRIAREISYDHMAVKRP